MTKTPSNPPEPQPQPDTQNIDTEALLQQLRRKEGNWVEWGQACQQLQQAGYSAQAIFEETGFEPIQQNQVTVAAQVHGTMLKAGVSETVRSRFEHTGSDTLYELRILTQPERAAAAEFIVARNLDSDGAREVAKAMKELSRRSKPPEGFTTHPGDAVAYQYWKLAKQQNDLQERSRLIARGLMFAHSQEARQQIEQLLSEFAGKPQQQAPRLPVYRLEAGEELPRLVPVVGQMPLSPADLQQTPALETEGPFQMASVSQGQQLVAIPGWQVVMKAQDPVGILCSTNQLPRRETDRVEDVLLVFDRKRTEWNEKSYFLVERSGELAMEWFSEPPNIPLLGSLILVLRPKKIIDEPLSLDIWQVDE